MRRLLVATQRIDPAHPALAATIPMLNALSERVDELVVLADAAVPGQLGPRCRVLTFGASGRIGRGVRFERALAGELRHRPLPVLAHMIPLFALLAAPLVRPGGQPLLLWYTHWKPTRALRVATRAATTVLSVDASSFPLTTPKLRAIGHGIDVRRFERERAPAAGPLRVTALGRTSPMKRYPTLLRAARLVLDHGVEVRVEIRGPSLTDEEVAERRRVERLVGELGLSGYAEVADPVSYAEVPGVLSRTDVLANLAEAADKIVYEAAAAGVLPVASAPAFVGLLPERLRFLRDDPVSLATALADVAAREPAERAALAASLRSEVERAHSVDSWADRVVEAAGYTLR
jgi:glycosyltransferase involved in cell wall biosynthesis